MPQRHRSGDFIYIHADRPLRLIAQNSPQDRHRECRALPSAPRQSLFALLGKIDELRELSATAFIEQMLLWPALCPQRWHRGRRELFAARNFANRNGCSRSRFRLNQQALETESRRRRSLRSPLCLLVSRNRSPATAYLPLECKSQTRTAIYRNCKRRSRIRDVVLRRDCSSPRVGA